MKVLAQAALSALGRIAFTILNTIVFITDCLTAKVFMFCTHRGVLQVIPILIDHTLIFSTCFHTSFVTPHHVDDKRTYSSVDEIKMLALAGRLTTGFLVLTGPSGFTSLACEVTAATL